MDKNAELRTASREDLLAIITRQQAVIAHHQTVIQELQRRVAALEEQLRRTGGGGAMPGTKPATTRRQERKPQRKQRDHGFARARMTPTEQVDHAVDVCPDCGTTLQGGWVQRTREVLEVPVAPLRVIQHRFIARVCPICGKRRVPPAELGGVVVGKQRLGVGLVSLIATLQEAGRLPIRTVQWLLGMLYRLRLSVGGITAALQGVARQGQDTVTAIRDHIRASPVVHADETGWREDGVNGYVWTFSTPSDRYFLRRGRGKGVVDEVLGDEFQGVLVSDFYAAYDHYAGLHQRCWAHLLREVHALTQLYPDNTSLARWAQAVRQVFDRGKAVTGAPRPRHQAQQQLSQELLALCQPFLDDPLAVQGKLCRRIQRFLGELLTFVGDPTVPADNNPAERSLRHLVTRRKISGGTRSSQGTSTAMILATLFGTWRAQGVDPLLACRQLLISPQL